MFHLYKEYGRKYNFSINRIICLFLICFVEYVGGRETESCSKKLSKIEFYILEYRSSKEISNGILYFRICLQ